MALNRLLLVVFAVVLSSVAAIASANGYGYVAKPGFQKPEPKSYVEKPKPQYAPKPDFQKPKPVTYSPTPKVEKPKTQYTQKPNPAFQKPKSSYATKSYFVKPKIRYATEPKTWYAPKPELERPKTTSYKAEEKPKPWYAPKPQLVKPKPTTYNTKPTVEAPKTTGYNSKPVGYAPKPKTTGYSAKPYTIAVEGLIYCRSGSKLVPIKGALARITCVAVDNNGYESAPFSVLSRPTDVKGYFFATVSPHEVEDSWKLTECKAFLEKSPSETCNVPTDVNKGINGAPLSSYYLREEKHVKLYPVGPFFYTPAQPKPVSKGY